MSRVRHPGRSIPEQAPVEVINTRPRNLILDDRVAAIEEMYNKLDTEWEGIKEMNALFKERIEQVNDDLERVHVILKELTKAKGPKIWTGNGE